MIISQPNSLRSLVSEAGRQADFYTRKHDGELALVWQDLEEIASLARHSGMSLNIEIRERVITPLPIKGCE